MMKLQIEKSVTRKFMSLYKKLFNGATLKSIAGKKLKPSDRSMKPCAMQ
jgi:hypothetical protein